MYENIVTVKKIDLDIWRTYRFLGPPLRMQVLNASYIILELRYIKILCAVKETLSLSGSD
jgi:hypothetical protein